MKGSQARTERAKFHFKVSEVPDGTPWIMTEPIRGTMPVLENAFIGFDLPNGTSFQRAKEVAHYMNENLAGISMTIFDSHPMFRFQR